MKTIELIGLDAQRNMVDYIAYTNLQWRRKWYESGTFSVQIPASTYNPAVKYLYTKDRPEVGEITQVNFIAGNEGYVFALSGYFLEEQVNKRSVYPKGTGNILNAPSWVNQSGNAEDVAIEFFRAFKDVELDGKSALLDIGVATSQQRGLQVEHERTGDRLGDKIHTILKPSEMSYKIAYDFVANTETFTPVKGRNLTASHEVEDNPVTFSTAFGNLKNPNIKLDIGNYRNSYIASNSYSNNNIDYTDIQAAINAADGEQANFLYVDESLNKSDYSTSSDYVNAIHAAAKEELSKHVKEAAFDFDAMEGSYVYMEDFDLGDKCSLEVPEIRLSKDAVLIECTEVIKKGTHTLSMKFDTDN